MRFESLPPPPARRTQRGRGGFSLIEFTVVLVLIGLLASVVTVSVRHHLIRGKQNAARGQIAQIREAVDSFYVATGRYPTNEEGLDILTRSGEHVADPLLPRVPTDPWTHKYVYNQPGRTEPYEIICLGADGREGGSGADADITSSDLTAKEVAPK